MNRTPDRPRRRASLLLSALALFMASCCGPGKDKLRGTHEQENQRAGAALLKTSIEDNLLYRRAHAARRERDVQTARNSVGNLEASIPHATLMTYPQDWPQKTLDRNVRGSIVR